LVAAELNATYRPFAEIEGELLSSFAALPSDAAEIKVVCALHPLAAPSHVSRTKICVCSFSDAP
jgi:hypothetical protein